MCRIRVAPRARFDTPHPDHDGPLAQALDADRQAELEATGERVLRTTREQAIRAPQQLVARLLAAGAPCAQKGVLH